MRVDISSLTLKNLDSVMACRLLSRYKFDGNTHCAERHSSMLLTRLRSALVFIHEADLYYNYIIRYYHQL